MLRALMISRLIFPVVALSLLALTGCGDDAPPPAPSGTLSGTVKSKGKICGGCVMSIYAEDTLFRKGARVDDSGSYELKGIPFGEYSVKVFQTPSNDPDAPFDKRIPGKYRDFKTSGLTVSIPSEEAVVYDIEMK